MTKSGIVGGNWIQMINDVDAIANNVARVRHPLATYHELIFGIVAERVGHAAVPPRDSYAASV